MTSPEHDHAVRLGRWVALVCVAGLGAGLGLLVTTRTSGACSCRSPEWQVQRRSVVPEDPDVSHEPYWSLEGGLLAHSGGALLYLSEPEGGQVWLVTSD